MDPAPQIFEGQSSTDLFEAASGPAEAVDSPLAPGQPPVGAHTGVTTGQSSLRWISPSGDVGVLEPGSSGWVLRQIPATQTQVSSFVTEEAPLETVA